MAIKNPYGFRTSQPQTPTLSSPPRTDIQSNVLSPVKTINQPIQTPGQRLTAEQEFGTPRTVNVNMVGGNPTATPQAPILRNTETVNGVTQTVQSPSIQTPGQRLTAEQEFGTPPPSTRPVTPPPTMTGSTLISQQGGFREYSLDEQRMMTQSIIDNQLAGKPITEEQRAFIANMQTQNLFGPQMQVSQYEEQAQAQQAEMERQMEELRQEIEQTKQTQDTRRQTELEQIQARLEQQYQPIIERTREQGQQAISTQGRLLGATGALTGSIGVQAMNKIDQEVTNMLNAIEAEKRQAFAIEKARLEGQDAEIIGKMQDSLQRQKEIANQARMENLNTLSQLRMQAEEIGNTNLINLLSSAMVETAAAGRAANDKLSSGLGYLVDDFGQPILSEDGQTIPFGAQNTLGSKYLNTQQDPLTGAMYAIKQDPDGNVYAELINIGGQNMPSEFGGLPDQNSMVAKYDRVFEGSKYNPNGIDLAGAKGSPITSSVAGEVIFAGNKGDWGNVVQIRAADGKIHQFAHLDNIGVQVGQRVSQLAYLGGMGNTGNVLKDDGTPPTPKELAAGRGVHLDYTVYDANNKVLPLEVAMAYAGLGQQPFQNRQQTQTSGQGLSITPKWQIDQMLDNAKFQQQETLRRAEEARKAEETRLKETRDIIESSKTGRAVQGTTGLITNIDRMIQHIEQNGLQYRGEAAAKMNEIGGAIAVNYKNAAELGALVGADWQLVDAVAPRVELNEMFSDRIKGRNADTVLAALRQARANAEREYNNGISTLQQLYPNVDISQLAVLQVGANAGAPKTTNTSGQQRYQVKPGLSTTQQNNLRTLLSTPAGVQAAIQQGLITPL
jgi:murein DD-endopeptidase MepM/ murein hydrolase activator NlpD